MVDFIAKTLEESVEEFPEDEKEEAKAKILEAWGGSMFYSGGPSKVKNGD
jgi:predicted house-cleaning noncanonical NTP pyrophosphatase (MazG superfamily)